MKVFHWVSTLTCWHIEGTTSSLKKDYDINVIGSKWDIK